MERNKKGQFVKGSNGNAYNGFGIWYDKKGYPTIWINNKSIKLHVYIWEKENGEKPKGMQLHHKDFNKKNYDIENLELVNQSDHFKIHAGWKRENGEWTKKPCKDCKKLLPLNNFYQRKGLTPSNHCIECSKILFKERNTEEYKAKRKIYVKNYYKLHKEEILQKQKYKWHNDKKYRDRQRENMKRNSERRKCL